MAVAWFFRSFLLLSSFLVLLPLTFAVSDSEALLKLKKSFISATALDSWCPAQPLAVKEDLGMDCFVTMRLSRGLRSFSVINNSFTGIIPEINRLSVLKTLFLSGNQFSGKIPSDYFAKMGSLKRVWLAGNKLTGNIPLSLGQLSHLIELHLENNQFSGHIPAFNHQTLKSINQTINLKGIRFLLVCKNSRQIHLRKIQMEEKKKRQDCNVFGRGSSNEAVEVQVSVPAARREVEVSRKSETLAVEGLIMERPVVVL
ncbi:hypothetical protein CRYUN_Cryun37aG0067500 [Craigia yunnanensis]